MELAILQAGGSAEDVAQAAASGLVAGVDTKMIARSFRYMRRKPTIISYKPPEGKLNI